MFEERIHYLVERFFKQACTAEEQEELARWIDQSGDDDTLQQVLQRAWEIYEPEAPLLTEKASARIMGNIFHKKNAPGKKIVIRRAAAAAAILVILAGGYAALKYRQPVRKAPLAANITIPQPVGNKVSLSLGNGSVITLDSAMNGSVVQQQNVSITKTDSGLVTYQPLSGAATKYSYDTLKVRRGGQFRVILSDGTEVWLNAMSSLRFPEVFRNNGDRRVELTGEGYFKVAASAAHPFHVTVNNGVDIAVLGTDFNVMAYPDEQYVRTTLLAGKVLVKRGPTTLSLAPGYQALLDKQTGQLTSAKVNTREATAWKDGRFLFTGATIKDIMQQLSRWYNIEVIYESEVNERFHAEILRSDDAATALRKLELTGKVHFQIDGSTVTVRP